MISEAFLLVSIFALCVFLAYEDLRSAFIFILLVSPLLHKEVFSLVTWDLLPVRIVTLAVFLVSSLKIFMWFRRTKDIGAVKRFLSDPVMALLLALWFVRLASFINSGNLKASFLILSFFTVIIFLYGLISYLARRYGVKFILSNIKFYSFIAFGTALVALLQFFLDLKYGIIFGALWRIPGKLSRVGSVFWDVNHYAGFLSSIIPIVFGLALVAKTKFSRAAYGFMALFMTGILILTNSRSAWIGFAVSILVLSLNLISKKFGAKKIVYLFLVLAFVSVLGGVSYMDRDSVIRERINSYFHYRGDSFASHFLLLEGAYEVFKSHPVLGGGYGSFFEHFKDTGVAAVYYGRDPAALSVRVPVHSIWGEVLSETGVLGIFVFTGLVIIVLGTLFYAYSLFSNEDAGIIALSGGSSVLGLLVSGIFYSYNLEFFWLVMFLLLTFAKSVLGEKYSFSDLTNYLSKNSRILFYAVAVFSAFLIFVNLGENSLIPWDEAIYAKISKNMVDGGDYLVQRWDGEEPWFEKPPLYMWFSSFFMQILGFESLAPKLPSAIFGYLTVLLLFAFVRKFSDSVTAFLSSLILLTTTHFLLYSRMAMLDVALTFFITVTLYCFYIARKGGSYRWWLLSGFAAGSAVMTKGVVGLLPLVVIFIYEIAAWRTDDRIGTLKQTLISYLPLFSAFLLVSLPWHLFTYLKFKDEFLQSYLGYHVVKRATESVEGKGQPWYWYGVVMKVSMRVWFGVLLAAIVSFVFRAVKSGRQAFRSLLRSRALFLSVVWFLVFLVFFSVSVSKLTWYIMPLYPPAAVISAVFISRAFKKFLGVLGWQGLERFYPVFGLFIGAFGLFYLFLVRSLVYVSDNTGEIARLVRAKDVQLGTEEALYFDRIEKSLVIYYSESPVEGVDYEPLRRVIKDASFDEPITYITKVSRYEKLSKEFPSTDLIERSDDFALARVRSGKELLHERIAELEAELNWIKEESVRGSPDAIDRLPLFGVKERLLNCLKNEFQTKSSGGLFAGVCE